MNDLRELACQLRHLRHRLISTTGEVRRPSKCVYCGLEFWDKWDKREQITNNWEILVTSNPPKYFVHVKDGVGWDYKGRTPND